MASGLGFRGIWYQPRQKSMKKHVVTRTFPRHKKLAIATTKHTVKNAPQTEQGGPKRSTKSPTLKVTLEETDSIYSSTFASKRLPTTVFTETDNYSTNDTATVNFNAILLPIKDDTDAIHFKDEAVMAACSVIAGFVLLGVFVFIFMLKSRNKCLDRLKNNDTYTEPVQIDNNYERTKSNKDVYDHIEASPPKIQVSENEYSFLRMTPQEKNNNANAEKTFHENVYNCTLDMPTTCFSVNDYDSFRKVADGDDDVTYDSLYININNAK